MVHGNSRSLSTCNVSAFNCLVNYVVVSRGRMIMLGSYDSLNIHATYELLASVCIVLYECGGSCDVSRDHVMWCGWGSCDMMSCDYECGVMRYYSLCAFCNRQ